MELPQNSLQARAQGRQAADRPLVEPVVELHGRGRSPAPGFDWILLDTRALAERPGERCSTQLQAAAPYATHPVVRVPWNDMVTIKRVLDIGAQSLLVPYVASADEARTAVAHTRYPPKGVRGVAGTTRATRFGRIKDYAKRAHEEICVLVQVETAAALDEHRGDLRRSTASTACSSGRPTCTPRSGYAGETANPEGEAADRRRHPPHPQGRQGARAS